MDRFWQRVADGLKEQYGGEWTVGPGDASGSTFWHVQGIELDPHQRAAIDNVLVAVAGAHKQSALPGEDFGRWLVRAVKSGLTNWSIPPDWIHGIGFDQPLGLIRMTLAEQTEHVVIQSLLERYFSGFTNVRVYPLEDKEWIIFFPAGRSARSTVVLEQMLEHAEGLYAVMLEELGRTAFLLADRPRRWFQQGEGVQLDGSGLLQAIFSLRQMGNWVRHWLPEEPVHGIWSFQTEKLVIGLNTVQQHQWLLQLGGVEKWDAVAGGDADFEETLRIWIRSDANISETAKRLFIHRNTLQYRLEKIRGLLGLDPRRLEDLFLIKLGLILYKLHKK